MKPSLKYAFSQLAIEQGNASERYVDEALKKAKETGKLPPWLLGWSHSKKWSPTDRAGIDFLIWTDRGRIIIDTKSSYPRAKLFMDDQRRRNGHKRGNCKRLAVAVNILEPQEEFIGKFISIIGDLYRTMSEIK